MSILRSGDTQHAVAIKTIQPHSHERQFAVKNYFYKSNSTNVSVNSWRKLMNTYLSDFKNAKLALNIHVQKYSTPKL